MQKTIGAAFGGAPRGRRFAPPPWAVVFASILYDFSTIFGWSSMFFNDFCRKDWFPRLLLSRPHLGVTENTLPLRYPRWKIERHNCIGHFRGDLPQNHPQKYRKSTRNTKNNKGAAFSDASHAHRGICFFVSLVDLLYFCG